MTDKSCPSRNCPSGEMWCGPSLIRRIWKGKGTYRSGRSLVPPHPEREKLEGDFLECCCCYCYVTSVMSDSVRPHRWQPTRLPCPWDSPGKNTGVGCHFLFQCMKGKSESEVAQSCPTLSDPMDCSLPGSSIHGIFQAGVLEWSDISFSVPPSTSSCFKFTSLYLHLLPLSPALTA